MNTMNISLPQVLRAFVEKQVVTRGYGTTSEYLRELIRKDQERLRLRDLLLDGAASPSGQAADAEYFTQLRTRAQRRSSRTE